MLATLVIYVVNRVLTDFRFLYLMLVMGGFIAVYVTNQWSDYRRTTPL